MDRIDNVSREVVNSSSFKALNFKPSQIQCFKCDRICSTKNGSGGKFLCTICFKTHGFCLDCKSIVRKSKLSGEICEGCRKINSEYSRTCYKCKVNKIPPEEDDEVDMCISCYQDEYMRVCKVCRKKTIYPKAHLHVDVCFGCKKGSSNQVSKGNMQNSNSANSKTFVGKCTIKGCSGTVDAEWKKICFDCYKRSKR